MNYNCPVMFVKITINMTKSQIIQQAYHKYWNEAKDWINKNGFFNGEAESLSKLRTKLYMDCNIEVTIIDEIQFVRPKTLKGLEFNNGWKKIDEELPNLEEERNVIFLKLCKNPHHTNFPISDVKEDLEWFKKRYTHWRYEEKILMPIY